MQRAALRFAGGARSWCCPAGAVADRPHEQLESNTLQGQSTQQAQAIIRFERKVNDYSTACIARRQDASDGEVLVRAPLRLAQADHPAASSAMHCWATAPLYERLPPSNNTVHICNMHLAAPGCGGGRGAGAGAAEAGADRPCGR